MIRTAIRIVVVSLCVAYSALFMCAPTQAQTLTTQSVCKMIIPPADGAAYNPDTDVYGQPVAPVNLADMNGRGPLSAFDDPVQIPIEIDLMQKFGLTLSPSLAGAANLNPILGFLSVHKDGRVLFNGQDVSAQIIDTCVPTLKHPPSHAPDGFAVPPTSSITVNGQ